MLDPRKKNLTIRDISNLTGFSRSTVSLVLNNSPKVNPKTRERILEKIREVDYHPNARARGLAARRANTIAVVVPPIRQHLFSDFYYSEALGGIAESAALTSYDLLLEIATDKFFVNRKYLRIFKEVIADGVLFLGASEEEAYIQQLHAEGYPVLLVNTRIDSVPTTIADNERSARQMIHHLADLGHRRIAVIGAPLHISTSKDRMNGYLAGLKDRGIELPERYMRMGEWTQISGRECGLSLLSTNPPPTAIVATNDMMAIGAIRALRDQGLQIPRDMSVVGADDIALSTLITPPLTTIRQPIYEIGRRAMEELIRAVEDGEQPETQVVPTELVIRNSSAPPARS